MKYHAYGFPLVLIAFVGYLLKKKISVNMYFFDIFFVLF